jgi:hypothetical protein
MAAAGHDPVGSRRVDGPTSGCAEPSREAMMTPPSLLGSAYMRKDPMMRC